MAIQYIENNASLGSPSEGDSIYVTGGSVTIDQNQDQSGLAAGGLTAVYVSQQFTGNMGTSAAPFKAEINPSGTSPPNGIFRWLGSGQCWYTPDGNSDICDILRVLNGTMNLVGSGTVNDLEIGGGRTIIGSSIVATTIRQASGECRVEGLAGTAPTTVEIVGGTYYTRRGIAASGSLTLYGGTAQIDAQGNTIPTLNMSGGALELRQSGTITTMNLRGGDAENIVISRPITITTLNLWSSVRNASAFTRNPLLTITTLNWKIDQG